MRRFNIDAGMIIANACVIKGSDANHMVNVLRLKKGDPVILLDGSGGEYQASIDEMDFGL